MASLSQCDINIRLQMAACFLGDKSIDVVNKFRFGYGDDDARTHLILASAWLDIIQHFDVEEKIKDAISISFTNSGTNDYISDLNNSFIRAGFKKGDVITVSGSTSNNGTFTVKEVAAGVLMLSSSDSLTTEAAGDSVTIKETVSNCIEEADMKRMFDQLASCLEFCPPPPCDCAEASCWNTPPDPCDDVLLAPGAGNTLNVNGSTLGVGCHPTGCTDPLSPNYDPNAVIDDGSCRYPTFDCYDGTCTDTTLLNNPYAGPFQTMAACQAQYPNGCTTQVNYYECTGPNTCVQSGNATPYTSMAACLAAAPANCSTASHYTCMGTLGCQPTTAVTPYTSLQDCQNAWPNGCVSVPPVAPCSVFFNCGTANPTLGSGFKGDVVAYDPATNTSTFIPSPHAAIGGSFGVGMDIAVTANKVFIMALTPDPVTFIGMMYNFFMGGIPTYIHEYDVSSFSNWSISEHNRASQFNNPFSDYIICPPAVNGRYLGDPGLHAIDDTTLVVGEYSIFDPTTSAPSALNHASIVKEAKIYTLDISELAILSAASQTLPDPYNTTYVAQVPPATQQANLHTAYRTFCLNNNRGAHPAYHGTYGDYIIREEGGAKYAYIIAKTFYTAAISTSTCADKERCTIVKMEWDTGVVVEEFGYPMNATTLSNQTGVNGCQTFPTVTEVDSNGANHVALVVPYFLGLGLFIHQGSLFLVSNHNQVWEINTTTCQPIINAATGGPVAFIPGFKSRITGETGWAAKGASQQPSCY